MRRIINYCALILALACLVIEAREKKLAIIITSYNNAEWYKANLGSVFDQEYDNYRVIYIDDCSTDGTPELVEKYIAERGQQHRCLLIKNSKRVRALANLYNAVHLCDDDEIVFNFDGDDWFAHGQVFSLINRLYDDPQVWITYGQFKNWPTEQMGYCKPLPDEVVQKQLYRQKWWAPGQLRTFYAWLFKKVHLKDLLFEGPYYQGQFFPANSDLAIYYPMMEMAGHRHKFISEVIYIRNVQTPINDFKANKDVQVMGSALIRAKKKYPLLPIDYHHQKKKSSYQADVIIFSSHAEKTAQLITTIDKLVFNVGGIHIVTHDESNRYDSFAALTQYPITIYKNPSRKEIADMCAQSTRYVVLLNDSLRFVSYVNLSEAIQALKSTHAYAFYFTHNIQTTLSPDLAMYQPVPVLNELPHNMVAWAFMYADFGQWRNPFQWGALYRKNHLSAIFENSQLSVTANMQLSGDVALDEVGICYKNPKLCYVAY